MCESFTQELLAPVDALSNHVGECQTAIKWAIAIGAAWLYKVRLAWLVALCGLIPLGNLCCVELNVIHCITPFMAGVLLNSVYNICAKLVYK